MTDLAAPPDTPAPPRRSRRLTAVAVVALTVVVVLAAIGLLALATEPRASTAPSGGGRIAVVDGAGHLRTVDAAGGAERRYDLAGLPSGFPAWSPDGEHLATVAVDGGDTALFVLDDAPSAATSGGLPDPVYRSPDEAPFYLYWSPDGRQLTFLTTEPDGLALRAVPADGSSPDAIVRRGAPMYWAWTADDRILLHAGGDGPDAYVGELGLNGSESRRAAVVPGQFQAPAVSADGQRRAYVISTAEPEPDIRSMVILVEDGRDGSIRRVAVRGPTALGWSPGQGGLGFIAPRQRDGLPVGSLEILDPASSQPRLLLDGDVLAFFWSPDGSAVAALALPTGQPRQVASIRALPDGASRPAAAAEGDTLELSIVAADDGAVLLQRPVRLSETFVNQLLPYFDQYALSHHLWAPDSSALVLPLVDDAGQPQVTIVPRDGGEPRFLGDGAIAFWGP
jgi:WD40 repeat protein